MGSRGPVASGACRVAVPGPGMARFAVAAVWVYEGVWAKVLDREPRQRRILAAFPGVGERRARRATLALGILEAAAAPWVLAGTAGLDGSKYRWLAGQIGIALLLAGVLRTAW